MTGIIHTKIKLKEYWYTLYNHTIICRIYDGVRVKDSKEEFESILYDYRFTYTYVHGRSLISSIEKRKKLGERIT